MASAERPLLAVEVLWAAGPHRVEVVTVRLPEGATVSDAVVASGLLARHGLAPSSEPGAAVTVARGGRACEPGASLRDRDRIELLRPLQVDPKEARRLRHRRQGGRRHGRTGAGG